MSVAMLCSDCAIWAANRDDSGASAAWLFETAKPGVLARIGLFVPDCGGDEAGHHAFSTAPCDGCGDYLAGDRCEAAWPDATMLATVLGLSLLEGALS